MNKHNTKKLMKRFPGFFCVTFDPMQSNMCFGFQCHGGWFNLIWELCERLEVLTGPDFEITTVKEKYGGLRFYPKKYHEEAIKLISDYEVKSEKICEECGQPSELRRYKCGFIDWVYNMCSRCWTNFLKKKESEESN